MIKNNIKAFLFHLLLIILSTIYLIALVSLSPYIGKYIVNPIFRGILAIIWAATYIFVGTKITINNRKKYDFSCGLLIAFLGLMLWAYSIYHTGFILGPISEELAYNYIPLNIYINPIYQISFLLNIEFNQLVRLISIFLPTVFIGLGVKIKRLGYARRKIKSKI